MLFNEIVVEVIEGVDVYYKSGTREFYCEWGSLTDAQRTHWLKTRDTLAGIIGSISIV